MALTPGPPGPTGPPGPSAASAGSSASTSPSAAAAATALAAERGDTPWDLDALLANGSGFLANVSLAEGSAEDYAFDRPDVRALFIVLYTIVFCCCFFGNMLVIVVVTMSRRLRSITNFFLANLAVADFCVGAFCVYQNLSIYLVQSWVLGDLVCKLYHFVHSLSYTASIFILVVICTERYFAIIHPITCKQILTPRRLRVVMLCVWVLSALYSSPRFFWVEIISMQHTQGGGSEVICISHRQKYDSETFDLINFGLLYAAPLAVMLLLYTRIALVLWDAGRGPPGIHRHRGEERSGSGAPPPFCRGVAPTLRVTFDAARDTSNGTGPPADARVSIASEDATATLAVGAVEVSPTTQWNNNHPHRKAGGGGGGGRRSRGSGATAARCYHVSASQNILKARRGVVRMLIVVVFTFAVCNLPYHARKMWQYWSPSYEGDSKFMTIFTPATFLLTYFNSAINPLLYAFLSRNFRKGMRELLLCPSREKGRPLAAQSSITRKTSVRSNTKLCPNAAALAALEHSG